MVILLLKKIHSKNESRWIMGGQTRNLNLLDIALEESHEEHTCALFRFGIRRRMSSVRHVGIWTYLTSCNFEKFLLAVEQH